MKLKPLKIKFNTWDFVKEKGASDFNDIRAGAYYDWLEKKSPKINKHKKVLTKEKNPLR